MKLLSIVIDYDSTLTIATNTGKEEPLMDFWISVVRTVNS